MFIVFPCVLAVLGLSSSAGRADSITTASLLREMTDLRRLADFPRPAYKTVQFSSFDRRSNLPGGPGWFANNDGFGGEPTPNFQGVLKPADAKGVGEYVICDVPGPGAIVRTWTAEIAGDLRVLLDGSDTPLYAGPAQDFLACPYEALAKQAGVDLGPLADTFQQHQAAYCPIPFAQRCRIIWIGDVKRTHFYHVNIRLYESGAAVTTFSPDDLKKCAADVQEIAQVLGSPAERYKYASTRPPVAIEASIKPHESQVVLQLGGPAALERLSLKLEAENRDLALRQTVLHVICDDYPWGQVQAPVGDFFGAAPGVNPYDSLPFTVAPDGTMTCRFVMPCQKSLRIRLDNRGAQAVKVTGAALPMDYAWNNETSMHFRARWRVEHDIIAGHDPGEDLAFLLAGGTGVYVGTTALLLNPCAAPTPAGGWWGEGDEKIFIDEDVVPSTFGTGSEDYFNYAWSVPDIFFHSYCGQPRDDGPGNRGFVTNFRWHILDALPFRQRIAFYLELISHDRTPGMSYARIAYHYARPGVYDDHRAIRDEDLRALDLPPNWQPAPRGAAQNTVFQHAAEVLPAGVTVVSAGAAVAPGAVDIRERAGNLWAGSKLLVWQPAQPGADLALRVTVPNDGKFALHLGLALDGDSGVVSVKLDGRAVGFGGDAGVIDLGAPHRTMLRQFSSSDIELKGGEHTLTVRYEGPSKSGGKTVGMDYLGVQKK